MSPRVDRGSRRAAAIGLGRKLAGQSVTRVETNGSTIVFSDSREPRTLNISLLNRLREAGGEFVPLDLLGGDLARVREDLGALERFGFQLERHPYLGTAYRGPTSRLCPDQLEHELGTERIGRRIVIWNRLGSTSDLAARAATSMANDGLVVLAEEQTAGRGQRGRSWTAPPGSSILMSVLIFPPPGLTPPGQDAMSGCAWLTALGAVAAADLVSEWTGADARIKWPNDVRVEGRKIAGILVERALTHAPAPAGAAERIARHRGVVIGIGLNGNIQPNSFPSELSHGATSMSILAGAPVDRSEVARDLIRRLDDCYDRVLSQGPSSLSASWRALSEHLGQMVRVVTPLEQYRGRLVDLDLQDGLTLDPRGSETAETLSAISPVTASETGLERVALSEVLSLEE
jgi:BirA family biotin operon repressor/biotin-[acetyl-CoA-carboxylase] ligase